MKRPRTLLGLALLLLLSGGLALLPAHAADDAKDKEKDQDQDETWQVPVTLGPDGWMIYENERFGFTIPVPAGMLPAHPPFNGDGQRFVSADEKVTLVAYGSFNVEGTADLEVRWKDELAESGRTITYKRKTEKWFVISGVMKDGTAFYLRYTADNKYASGWVLTYPHAEEKKYATWVERVAKGYDPRLGKGFDTLE